MKISIPKMERTCCNTQSYKPSPKPWTFSSFLLNSFYLPNPSNIRQHYSAVHLDFILNVGSFIRSHSSYGGVSMALVPASADYNTSQALQMCPGSSASICTYTYFLQMVTPMKIFLYLYFYIENGTYNQYAWVNLYYS